VGTPVANAKPFPATLDPFIFIFSCAGFVEFAGSLTAPCFHATLKPKIREPITSLRPDPGAAAHPNDFALPDFAFSAMQQFKTVHFREDFL
jgi:hypothetical protein